MKISIIIPVYNAEKTIISAVESALQFEQVYEVIIIENNSSDHTLQICNRLCTTQARVKLYQHPDIKNHGAHVSRNLGIIKSTGDFIAFLDADSSYLPNRFDAEKELFTNPEVDGVFNAMGVHYYTEKSKENYYHVLGYRLCITDEKYKSKILYTGPTYTLGPLGLFCVDKLTLRKESFTAKIETFFTTHKNTAFLFRLSYNHGKQFEIIDEVIAIK